MTNYYDELGVAANAAQDEIQPAYERLLRHLSSGEHGLPQDEARRRIERLNQAYWMLSERARRAGYDAMLASNDGSIQLAVEIREPRWTPQKILLIVIGGLIAAGLALQIIFSLYSWHRARQIMEDPSGFMERRSPEEIAAEQEREEKRAREAEEQRLAAEERRLEYERKEAERKRERELEENRRYADQVSRDLRRAEEQAKREADAERRRAEQEERARLEAEKRRAEQLQYQWRQQLRH